MFDQLMQRLDTVTLNGHKNPIWLQQLQTIYTVAYDYAQSKMISKNDWQQIVNRISRIQDQFNAA